MAMPIKEELQNKINSYKANTNGQILFVPGYDIMTYFMYAIKEKLDINNSFFRGYLSKIIIDQYIGSLRSLLPNFVTNYDDYEFVRYSNDIVRDGDDRYDYLIGFSLKNGYIDKDVDLMISRLKTISHKYNDDEFDILLGIAHAVLDYYGHKSYKSESGICHIRFDKEKN